MGGMGRERKRRKSNRGTERCKRREKKGRGRESESCLSQRIVGRGEQRRWSCLSGQKETESGQILSLKVTGYPDDRAGP